MGLIVKAVVLTILEFLAKQLQAWLDKLKAEKQGQVEQQAKQDGADLNAITNANKASSDVITEYRSGGVPGGQAGKTTDPDQRD